MNQIIVQYKRKSGTFTRDMKIGQLAIIRGNCYNSGKHIFRTYNHFFILEDPNIKWYGDFIDFEVEILPIGTELKLILGF